MASIHRPSRRKAAYETRPCQCGCGKTFVLDLANRSRKYAADCPFKVQRQQAYSRAQAERQRLAKAGQLDGSLGRTGAVAPHRKVKVCGLCGNLPERRLATGCPRCKFPAGPAAPIGR